MKGGVLVKKLSLGLVALFSFVGVVTAPAAQAAVNCNQGYSQPFAQWGDYGYYALAPNGSFEGNTASGWSLAGGATVKSPGNPLRQGRFALSLPKGSTATSPPICVEAGSPHARMFALTSTRNSSVGAALRVELVYTDVGTGQSTIRAVGTLAQRSSWSPTERMALGGPVNIKPGADGRLTVRYRFTPIYSTAWMIDDLFIDPKKAR